jgi:hypothetical protein
MKSRISCKTLVFNLLIWWLLMPAAAGAALRVKLRVENRTSVNRINEPVTSGVPLPRGLIFVNPATGQPPLKITDSNGKQIPAQFTVLANWPDGSIRWVLLDFAATVMDEETAVYYLEGGGRGTTSQGMKLEQTEERIEVDTGKLRFSISKEGPNIFQQLIIRGPDAHSMVISQKPNGIELLGVDNQIYASYFGTPDQVVVEEEGPLRSVILVRGKFTAKDGKTFHPQTARYSLRIHSYYNQDYIRLFLSLENNGKYGFRHEDHQSEAFDFKRLALKLKFNLEPTTYLRTQGYGHKYNPEDRFFLYQYHRLIDPSNEEQNFSYTIKQGNKVEEEGERSPGWLDISDSQQGMTVAVRHFWQNYPKSITFWHHTLSLGLWPLGGKWPPTAAENYRFRGGTHKTYEILLRFYQRSSRPLPAQQLVECFQNPLFAVAPPEWYADSKALGLTAPKGLTSEDPVIAEALQRYEKLQACKVHLEESETQHEKYPPSTIYTEREQRGEGLDWYGWMDFGDIPWGGQGGEGAYSSGHYDWPYGMLLQFVRSGDYAFFRLGEEMARHRMDIDQYHTDRGSPYLNHFQWNEFGNHDRNPEPWEPKPSHTWIQGLILYHLLTGDRKAKEAALEVGQAISTYWQLVPGSAEIRIQGWSIENLLALYQLTGKQEYLDLAVKIYREKTTPFISPEGYVGNPQELNIFQPVLALEPLIKLDLLTNDEDLRDSILRMLDFLVHKAYRGGKDDGGGRYQPMYLPFTLNIKTGFSLGTAPGYNFMTSNALAYAYMVTGEEEYLKLARQLFKDAVFYWQEEVGRIDPKRRSPIAYAAAHFPGSRSKVHGWINRYPQIYLYMEAHPKSDTIPPAAITDLEVTPGPVPGSVILDWTAPGDDDHEGTARSYQIKYATHHLGSRLEWLQAENVAGEPQPQPPYRLEHFAIEDLAPGTTYFFAIRAYDEEGNQSAISNVASITLGEVAAEDGEILDLMTEQLDKQEFNTLKNP